MRCPKCGFISFDHLTSCAKCGKDIGEVASELQGTSIKVQTPMFLSSTLASYADRDSSLQDYSMDETEAGIDFSMEDNTVTEEPIEMASAESDIDFSIEAEETEEVADVQAKDEEAVDFIIEAEPEVEEEVTAEVAEESIDELDLMSSVDTEDSGLEFDLEDFIEDLDEEKSGSSGKEDLDLDPDTEEK